MTNRHVTGLWAVARFSVKGIYAKAQIVSRSLERGENKHDVSWKPFVGTLRVESPCRRA